MFVLKEARGDVEWYRKPSAGDYISVKDSTGVKRFPKELDKEDVFDYKDWKDLIATKDEEIPQFFIAYLRKEKEYFLVNTEGYSYPRYIAFIRDNLKL